MAFNPNTDSTGMKFNALSDAPSLLYLTMSERAQPRDRILQSVGSTILPVVPDEIDLSDFPVDSMEQAHKIIQLLNQDFTGPTRLQFIDELKTALSDKISFDSGLSANLATAFSTWQTYQKTEVVTRVRENLDALLSHIG